MITWYLSEFKSWFKKSLKFHYKHFIIYFELIKAMQLIDETNTGTYVSVHCPFKWCNYYCVLCDLAEYDDGPPAVLHAAHDLVGDHLTHLHNNIINIINQLDGWDDKTNQSGGWEDGINQSGGWEDRINHAGG